MSAFTLKKENNKTKPPSYWLKKKQTLPCRRHNEIYIMEKTINGGKCGICLHAIESEYCKNVRGILNTTIKWKDRGNMKGGPCDHVFCFTCINEWSKQERTCPICRETFTRIEKFNIQTQTTIYIEWRNTGEDMPMRRIMIGKIVSFLKEKKPDADESWKKKLPDMARRLEDSLYRGAPDKATYSDEATLKTRLREVAMMMTRKKQAMHSNEPPKPVPISKIDDKVIDLYLQKFKGEKKKQFSALPKEQQQKYIVKIIYARHKQQWDRKQQIRKEGGTLQAKMVK